MEILSKDQVEAFANEVFEREQDVTECFGTVDGQIFYKKMFAELHAGDKGTVYHFEKTVTAPEPPAPKADSIPVLTEKLELIISRDVLLEMREAEVNGANRKGALEAIDTRLTAVSIETVTEKDSLTAMLETERNGPKRKGIIQVIEARIAKLSE